MRPPARSSPAEDEGVPTRDCATDRCERAKPASLPGSRSPACSPPADKRDFATNRWAMENEMKTVKVGTHKRVCSLSGRHPRGQGATKASPSKLAASLLEDSSSNREKPGPISLGQLADMQTKIARRTPAEWSAFTDVLPPFAVDHNLQETTAILRSLPAPLKAKTRDLVLGTSRRKRARTRTSHPYMTSAVGGVRQALLVHKTHPYHPHLHVSGFSAALAPKFPPIHVAQLLKRCALNLRSHFAHGSKTYITLRSIIRGSGRRVRQQMFLRIFCDTSSSQKELVTSLFVRQLSLWDAALFQSRSYIVLFAQRRMRQVICGPSLHQGNAFNCGDVHVVLSVSALMKSSLGRAPKCFAYGVMCVHRVLTVVFAQLRCGTASVL